MDAQPSAGKSNTVYKKNNTKHKYFKLKKNLENTRQQMLLNAKSNKNLQMQLKQIKISERFPGR